MSAHSEIAVAIPAYKRPAYLEALVATVPANVSVYVSDNESSLEGLLPELRANVHIAHVDRLLPIFANWNNALALVPASCTHIVIPSDDDLFTAGAFDTIEFTIAENPDVDVFVFGCDIIDESGRKRPGYVPRSLEKLEPGQGFLKFRNGVEARMPAVVFRHAFLKSIGGFDERFKLTAADSELIQRALLLGTSLFIPKIIGSYRVWAGGLTHSRQASDEWMSEISMWVEKIADIIRSKFGEEFHGKTTRQFQHEIIALNLLAGVNGLVDRNEFKQAKNFLHRYGIPAETSWHTRLRFMRTSIKTYLRQLSNT